MAKINVLDKKITIFSQNEKDFIFLIDIIKNIENGLALIEK